jgi:hypothetical protein
VLEHVRVDLVGLLVQWLTAASRLSAAVGVVLNSSRLSRSSSSNSLSSSARAVLVIHVREQLDVGQQFGRAGHRRSPAGPLQFMPSR